MVRLRSKPCPSTGRLSARGGDDDKWGAGGVGRLAAATGPPTAAAGECGGKDQVSRRGLDHAESMRQQSSHGHTEVPEEEDH